MFSEKLQLISENYTDLLPVWGVAKGTE